MPTLQRLPVDIAFVAFLRAGLATDMVFYGDEGDPGSGIPRPDEPTPYYVLYGIAGGDFYGPPLVALEDDAELIYQLTCVGTSARQAVWADDKARRLVVGRNPTGSFLTDLTIPGMAVINRKTEGTSAPEPTGALWQTTPRFLVTVTPA